jgi:oligoribonuclease NrnB/cAMP/cGMP phosphodiesterase (DHH superfamily)
MPLIISHGADLDGVASAVILKTMFPAAEVKFAGYKTVDDIIREWLEGGELHLFLADISPRDPKLLQTLEYNAQNGDDITILDHHAKTPWASGEINIVSIKGKFDEEKCGAEQALYAYLRMSRLSMQSAALARLAMMAQVRDYWKKDHEYWDVASDLDNLIKTFGPYWLMDMLLDDDKEEGTLYGLPYLPDTLTRVITGLHQERVRYTEERAQAARMELDSGTGHVFYWTYAHDAFSEIGEAIAEAHPEALFAAVVSIEFGSVSLRRRQGSDFDLGSVARRMDGGGHERAAGYPFDASKVNDIREILP